MPLFIIWNILENTMTKIKEKSELDFKKLQDDSTRKFLELKKAYEQVAKIQIALNFNNNSSTNKDNLRLNYNNCAEE